MLPAGGSAITASLAEREMKNLSREPLLCIRRGMKVLVAKHLVTRFPEQKEHNQLYGTPIEGTKLDVTEGLQSFSRMRVSVSG
jgi:hypothetical protein